ncbi:AMP-binding protein [Corynebacterium sp.]|jgi:long-subunit acyl-CoA synthetase (AMP-forming)|uniref:AMP-binding protein n=1 Tax=Corynebacterium sp. TaxID=1720 RepID=UPI0025BC2ADC|nr:AMP-binding protein [Corynebacterium sp.]
MTETSPVTHCAVLGEAPAASIGHPVSNTEAKVVDVSDESLPEITASDSDDPDARSASGELWIRGPQVMVGYLDNEEATARTVTPEEWLRTGDIVDLDRDGNVYVVETIPKSNTGKILRKDLKEVPLQVTA